MSTGLRLQAIAVAVAACFATVAAAKDGATVVGSSRVLFEAEEFPGSEYRDAVNDAFSARNDRAARWANLQPVLTFCDGKQDTPAQTWVAVSTAAEREEILADPARDAAKVQFVDIVCPRAYTMAAFFAVEEGEAARAIALLERAQALGPFAAAAFAERGFLHNAAGDRQQALAAYRHALALAERFPSAESEKPLALRGIGWTLIELGDYAGARQAYSASLEIEPGNETALAELAYVDKLIADNAPPPATPAFPIAAVEDSGKTPLPPDRQRIVDNTRVLEQQPFHPLARAMRSDMIRWLEEVPDVSVLVCDTLGLFDGTKGPYDAELLVQSMFGNAAFQLANPDRADDGYAVQRAGVESTLLAYAAILRDHPDARRASLDALLRHQAAGGLDAYLAPIVTDNCTDAAGADASDEEAEADA